jgi:DNA-binding NtrC family response regulator
MVQESVFVIDDEASVLRLAEVLLTDAGYKPSCFESPDLAITASSSVGPPAVVLFEVEEHESGEGRYTRLHDAMPMAKFIVISDATGLGTAAEALGLVALRKPFDEVALVQVVKNAIDGPLLNVPHDEGEKDRAVTSSF